MMETLRLILAGKVVIPECRVARSFGTRFMGLMGKKSIPTNEALLFPKCNSIHTFFMRFPIDVIFINREGAVVDVVPALKGYRMLLPRFKAAHTIEMAAGLAKQLGIQTGAKFEGLETL